ncbi:MAG: hypothetical protein Q9218_004458 [Villophora microphyllina]
MPLIPEKFQVILHILFAPHPPPLQRRPGPQRTLLPSAPKLKTLRLPIYAALHYIPDLEDCSVTPSEIHTLVFENPRARTVYLDPIASLIPIPPYYDNPFDGRQKYKPGSAAEMKAKKANGLRGLEEADKVEVVGE